MWRIINRKDFEGSNPFLGEENLHQRFRWRVYEDYEIFPPIEGSDWAYIQAVPRKGNHEPECVKVYDPFADSPHLFLEFARIVERRDPDQALQDWFAKYGLLGLTPRNPRYSKKRIPRDELITQIVPEFRHDDRGGPWDHFGFIWDTAEEANESLSLYEASLARDEQRLERALFPEEEDPEYAECRRRTLEERAEATRTSWVDTLVGEALLQVDEYTMARLHMFTYPHIAFPQQHLVFDMLNMPPLTVDHLTRGWGARNLEGAMWLQFYWLLTSGYLSRCKQCGGIISYAPPIPVNENQDARKPRKDKEFCDSRCRQNYHYHNRIKPRKEECS